LAFAGFVATPSVAHVAVRPIHKLQIHQSREQTPWQRSFGFETIGPVAN
jgi:hypothetical protein